MKKILFVVPLMAISLLASCNKGVKTVERTITFNIPNCKVYYGDDEIKSDPFKISVPDVNPYYVKFSLKGEKYTKPSNVNIKSGGKVYKDFEFYNNNGNLFINLQSNLVVEGACDTRKSLDDYTWDEIDTISKSGEANIAFRVGDTKKVQLKHQDSEGDGTDVIRETELYQTVRIIGINEDYTELPTGGGTPDPEKAIGITFEFADLISDENGLSIGAYWNDTENGSNHNYRETTIRKALNGTTNNVNWFRYYGKNEDTAETGKNLFYATEPNYKKSVFNMLPDSLTKEGILKTPAKYVNIYNSKLSTPAWEEQIVKDKLFLLTPVEMGRTDHSAEEPHTIAYSYYKNHTEASDLIRIKRQIKGIVGGRDDYVDVISGACKSKKISFAGYYEGAYNAGFSWLRSPNYSSDNEARFVSADGDVTLETLTNNSAAPVAPAFCI